MTTQHSGASALIKNGAWLDAQTFPPLAWAVRGLIPEGFGLLTGPPKLGKSWFTLALLLEVARGGRVLGAVSVDRRPVLYAALEDGDRRLQGRARHLLGASPIPESFDYVTDMRQTDPLELIGAWLELHPSGVVALDTLGRVMPAARPGESAYQRDYRIGAALKSLTDAYPGSTLLVVHHTRKQGSSDWMDSTSGTNGLNGAADWTLSLDRGRNDGDAVIRVTGRDVPEGEYAALMSDGAWRLNGTDLQQAAQAIETAQSQDGLGDASAEIVSIVADYPDGVTAAQVAEAMGWTTDSDKARARKYLRRLLSGERIGQPSRGLYTPVTTVTSVTTEWDDDTEVTLVPHVTPPVEGRSDAAAFDAAAAELNWSGV